MKTTPAQKRAKEKYTKENTRAYCLRLNRKTHQDIMAKLEAVERTGSGLDGRFFFCEKILENSKIWVDFPCNIVYHYI